MLPALERDNKNNIPVSSNSHFFFQAEKENLISAARAEVAREVAATKSKIDADIAAASTKAKADVDKQIASALTKLDSAKSESARSGRNNVQGAL